MPIACPGVEATMVVRVQVVDVADGRLMLRFQLGDVARK